jgi:hypothetical protein
VHSFLQFYNLVMPSIFDSCTDACGWIAAVVAAISYGSFGVPIKGTKDIDVHPLIFQSYKTFVMFVTCWGVKFLGVDIAFTKWGLLSGFLWVLGGVGGIYGIRTAGLAIAVGTWASIMVMINFLFGILIFKEPVADIWGTLCSFMLLIIGLVGMSIYSAPQPRSQPLSVAVEGCPEEEFSDDGIGGPNYQSLQENEVRRRMVDPEVEMEGLQNDTDDPPFQPIIRESHEYERYLVLFNGRLSLTKRQCGMLGAAMNGVMTGSSLLPVHYAEQEGFGGAKYFPSFACGAMNANIIIWCLYFGVHVISDRNNGKSMQDTLEQMPKIYFRALWLPGLLAGLLLSLAMFSSILAVTYLGQGVGNSVVQTKILVSGLWGIFWFHEIVGAATIAKWFASAGICMTAIIWLSLERLMAKSGGGHHS